MSDPLNPKDAVASAKPDLSLVTAAMMEAIAAALTNGAAKYGRGNWRQTPVRALVYTAAAARHIKAWEDGEDAATDSGVNHLDHAIASLCILRDAARAGTLIDDRVVLPAPASEPAPAHESTAEKRYGVFWVGNISRSTYVPEDFASREAARAAVCAHSRARQLADLYAIKELP